MLRITSESGAKTYEVTDILHSATDTEIKIREVTATVEDNQQELLENFPCAAQLAVASGHSLRCTERGHHTTHRFAVEV
jgi:hypothetical protein